MLKKTALFSKDGFPYPSYFDWMGESSQPLCNCDYDYDYGRVDVNVTLNVDSNTTSLFENNLLSWQIPDDKIQLTLLILVWRSALSGLWLFFTSSHFSDTDFVTGIGVCGWILFAISWLLVFVTLPFSLCVLLKVPSSYCITIFKIIIMVTKAVIVLIIISLSIWS